MVPCCLISEFSVGSIDVGIGDGFTGGHVIMVAIEAVALVVLTVSILWERGVVIIRDIDFPFNPFHC